MDRQRITALEGGHGPTSLQADRGDILRALILANGGKILAKEARGKMRLSKQQFSNLLAATKGITSSPYRLNKRQRLLALDSTR